MVLSRNDKFPPFTKRWRYRKIEKITQGISGCFNENIFRAIDPWISSFSRFNNFQPTRLIYTPWIFRRTIAYFHRTGYSLSCSPFSVRIPRVLWNVCQLWEFYPRRNSIQSRWSLFKQRLRLPHISIRSMENFLGIVIFYVSSNWIAKQYNSIIKNFEVFL